MQALFLSPLPLAHPSLPPSLPPSLLLSVPSSYLSQAYEAHIPFLLQFFIDYNVVGMGYIHLSNQVGREGGREGGREEEGASPHLFPFPSRCAPQGKRICFRPPLPTVPDLQVHAPLPPSPPFPPSLPPSFPSSFAPFLLVTPPNLTVPLESFSLFLFLPCSLPPSFYPSLLPLLLPPSLPPSYIPQDSPFTSPSQSDVRARLFLATNTITEHVFTSLPSHEGEGGEGGPEGGEGEGREGKDGGRGGGGGGAIGLVRIGEAEGGGGEGGGGGKEGGGGGGGVEDVDMLLAGLRAEDFVWTQDPRNG